MSEQVGPRVKIEMSLIEMTVSAETVLDALAEAVVGLGDVAIEAARRGEWDLVRQAQAVQESVMAKVRPLRRPPDAA